MKINKAIKKIVALGTGLTLVGATMFGAMAAADLSQYPNPLFIKEGAFDGVLVVGDNAAGSDVVGAIDIATNLQVQSVTTSVVSTSSATSISVTGDSKKIEQSTDRLEFNENLTQTGITTITATDMNALASGSFSNEFGTVSYDQYIELPTKASPQFAVDPDDDAEIPAPYLVFSQDALAYKYKVTFSPAWKSDNDANNDLEDFENKKITLLGKEYNVINVDHDGIYDINLELMGGAVTDTLSEAASTTYSISGVDYEVIAGIIATEGSTNKVILTINGENTDKLAEGETFKLTDGTEVGIKTIMNQNFAGGSRNVEFYLGAEKVQIDDQYANITTTVGTLTVGSDAKSAVDVQIKSNSDAGIADGADITISEIQVMYNATQDIYVPVDGKLSTAADTIEGETGNVFLNGFDIEFKGLEIGATEEIELKQSGKKDFVLKMTNKNGDSLSQEIYSYNDSSIVTGADNGAKSLVLVANSPLSKNDYVMVGDGQSKGHGTVLQYKGITTGDDKVKMKDVAAGETYEAVHDSTGLATFTLPGGYDVKVQAYDVDSSTSQVNITQNAQNYIYSGMGAKVLIQPLNNATGGIRINAINVTEEETEDNEVTTIQFGSDGSGFLTYGTTDGIEGIRGNVTGVTLTQVGDADEYEGYTKYGSKVYVADPTSGATSFKITYPDEQVTSAVFITSGVTEATTTSGTGDQVTTTTFTPIQVGTAKLASEIQDINAVNAIVLGGPCANKASADLLGVENSIPGCLSGLSLDEGNAVIKLFENGEKVSILVAGATALDTRRAARVLSEPSTYALEGTEMIVSGTTLLDIAISAPAPADETTDDTTTDDTTSSDDTSSDDNSTSTE